MRVFVDAVALVLGVAYVTTLVLSDPVFPFAIAAFGCSSVSFLLVVRPRPRDVVDCGVLYVVGFAGTARAVDAFDVFATAYVTCALLLAFLLVAHARGVVAYPANTASFVLTRSALYAFVRAMGAVVRRAYPDAYTASIDRLVLLGLATVETIGMLVLGQSAYPPAHIATYALLKTGVFACLPLLEDVLIQ